MRRIAGRIDVDFEPTCRRECWFDRAGWMLGDRRTIEWPVVFFFGEGWLGHEGFVGQFLYETTYR